MNLITLFWLPFVAGCRMTKFVQEEGLALENHVIKTVTAVAPIKCRWDCVDEPLCFSINVRKLPTGRVTCELNNSSKTADPQDLKQSDGTQYHQMAEVEHCTMDECIYKDALPDSWYRFNTKFIKLFPERRTWEQARRLCQWIDGDLLSINNEDENEFVYNLLQGQIKSNTEGNDPEKTIIHWILDGSDGNVRLEQGAKYEEEDGVKSLYLDGLRAYATTPAVDFGTGTSFTIASWVKLQSPVQNISPIYTDWETEKTAKFYFFTSAEQNPSFGVMDNQNKFMSLKGNRSSPVDKWFHVAAVWDSNENEARLFLDGGKIGTHALWNGSFPRKHSRSLYDIGLQRQAGALLRGHLRDLMIVGKALTEDDLAHITDPFGGAWIGLNDVTVEGTFRWSDENHVSYTKWSSNLPDKQNEAQDCVRMTVDKGAWDEIS